MLGSLIRYSDVFHLLAMYHGSIYNVQLQMPSQPQNAVSVEWPEKPEKLNHMARKEVFFFGQKACGAGGSLKDLSTLSFCIFIPQMALLGGEGDLHLLRTAWR